MGRPKREYDWESILAEVQKLRKDNPSLTVKELAKALRVQKALLARHMVEEGIPTIGQRISESRFQDRIDRTPVVDIVGIHGQRVRSDDLSTFSQIVAVAVANRGLPETRTAKKVIDLNEAALAPSFLSMDARRACSFEMNFSLLIESLDNPQDPKIDEAALFKALKEFSDFGKHHDYTVEIFVALQGSISNSARQIVKSVPECIPISWPIRHLLASIWSIPLVSCLGAGRLPLLGQTVERLKAAFALMKGAPEGQFHLSWKPDDIDSAMQGRLRVCDALSDTGLLYGAPLNKIAEMAAEAQSSLSRSVTKKTTKYGDGLHTKMEQRPKGFVQLGVPARLTSRYIYQLPVDLSGSRDLMDFRTVDIKGKGVECLVAWLPSLRNMLLRALRRPDFNSLMSGWLSEQQRTVEAMGSAPFAKCHEILNPEGTITFQSLSSVLPATNAALAENLALGLLLSAYDPDSLIGSLISRRDWRKCREWQEKWNLKVVAEARRKLETIVGRAKWDIKLEARWRLQSDLVMSGAKGHRLLRFILEEASANYARAFRQTGRRLGIDPAQGWPEESHIAPAAISILEEETRNVWPVVGVRMDFFVARQAALLRRHLNGDLRNRQEEGLVEYREDYEKHNESASENELFADYDPFEDEEH